MADANGDEQARLLDVGEAGDVLAPAAELPRRPAPVASGALSRAAAVASTRVAGAPVHAWAQLAVAVLAVSTAATAFLFARDVPPFLLAGWRLQLVTALLAPAAASQWRALSAADRLRWRASVRKMVAAGVYLAFHFGLWVSALNATSLPHALLFVSVTPVVLAGWALFRGVPLSRGELGGTAVAMLGAAVLVSDTSSDKQVTLRGDLMAVGSASVFGIYLTIGGELRAWMPLFVYAVPVNCTAAVVLSTIGMLFEGAAPWGAGREGVFGYFNKARYALTSVYLAVVPGIVGHTSFNAVLKFISPMVVTLAVSTEPLIGFFVGYFAGVTGPPGARTLAGGLILIGATLYVVRAEDARKKAAQVEAAQAPPTTETSADAEPHDARAPATSTAPVPPLEMQPLLTRVVPIDEHAAVT